MVKLLTEVMITSVFDAVITATEGSKHREKQRKWVENGLTLVTTKCTISLSSSPCNPHPIVLSSWFPHSPLPSSLSFYTPFNIQQMIIDHYTHLLHYKLVLINTLPDSFSINTGLCKHTRGHRGTAWISIFNSDRKQVRQVRDLAIKSQLVVSY